MEVTGDYPLVDPLIKCFICVDDDKKYIKDRCGDLVNPGIFRQIPVSNFSKKSWAKFRKKHQLKGRCEVYQKTDLSEFKREDGTWMINDELDYKDNLIGIQATLTEGDQIVPSAEVIGTVYVSSSSTN